MDVADDAEGLGNQVFAQRDVVHGSSPLKAQAYGGDGQVRAEGGLERCTEAERRCTALPDPLLPPRRGALREPVSAIRQGQPDTPRGPPASSGSSAYSPASGSRDKQTPMIVTSPTSIWVMPDTNCPGGSAAWPNHPRPSKAPWTTAGPSVCPPVPSRQDCPQLAWAQMEWPSRAASNARCPSR